jgi:hypothetical protein
MATQLAVTFLRHGRDAGVPYTTYVRSYLWVRNERCHAVHTQSPGWCGVHNVIPDALPALCRILYHPCPG